MSAANKYSGYAEQTFATTKICRFSDTGAAARQPSVRTLSEDQQEAVTTQPEIQAPQHCSSFPAAMGSTNFQQRHRLPSSATLPLYCLPPPAPPQLPSYAQSLAKSQFCYSECPPDPPAYTSSAVVSQPLRGPRTPVSTGDRHPSQVLRTIQSFSSAMSCGAASSMPSTMQLHSKKISRPTSTIHGTTIAICRSAGQSICTGLKNKNCMYSLYLFSYCPHQSPRGATPASSSRTLSGRSKSCTPGPRKPSQTSRPSSLPCRSWPTSRLLAAMLAPATSTC